MKKDVNVISTYELDDEKKDSITRYALEKILKDIKAALTKNGKIKITLERVQLCSLTIIIKKDVYMKDDYSF